MKKSEWGRTRHEELSATDVDRTIEMLRTRRVRRGELASVPNGYRRLWFNLQYLRRLYRKDLLPLKHRVALEAIPGWSSRPQQERSIRTAEALREFIRRHGWDEFRHNTVAKGMRLGKWVGLQRRNYSRRDSVDPVIRLILESIPGWTWQQSPQSGVDKVVDRTARKHLRALEKASGTVPGRRAACRLAAARKFLRKWYRKGRLSDSLVKKVEKLPGWTWDTIADVWSHHMAILRRLVKRRGELPRIPKRALIQGVGIGEWCRNCRDRYNEGNLPAEMVRELESLPGWTWGESMDERRRRNVALLKRFLRKHDLTDLRHYAVYRGARLHDWVQSRRQAYRRGWKQPEWLIRELEALPGWSWWPRDNSETKRRRGKSRYGRRT